VYQLDVVRPSLHQKDSIMPTENTIHWNRAALILIVVIGATAAGFGGYRFVHRTTANPDAAPSGILATAPAAPPRRLNADGAPMSD
jgi:hypothetical protein